jgi:outer membrane protein assembly factor BamD
MCQSDETSIGQPVDVTDTDGAVERHASPDQQMDVARYYLAKHDYVAALNRLKIVVTRFTTSQHLEEALVNLTEAYLALGIPSQAKTAVAVLSRRFPGGHWLARARAALTSAGLEADEDENSWISQTLK